MASKLSTGGAMLPNSIAEAWFGPGNPIPAVAPPDTAPRTRNYQFNTNLRYLPQKEFTYKNLRDLAESTYPLRVIMERFKKRIQSHDWEFRMRPEQAEPKDVVANRSWADPRVKMLTALFQRPDGEHGWDQWMNGWLEDNIVIDAVAIWADRDRKDSIARLIQLDGATISRIIDDAAMTPQPPYLAYRQIVHGLPAIDFMADDLQFTVENYRPHREFGFSTVEQTAILATTQINRAVWTLNHYTEGNIPEVFISFDGEKYSADQIREWVQNFESKLNGDLKQRQRVYPVPDAAGIHEMRGKELFEGFDEYLLRIFAFQIGEPVTALVKGNNRAEAKQIDDTREEAGEYPKLRFIRNRINDLVQNPYFFGFDDIEFDWRPAQTSDALEQAQIDLINVPLGITLVDECRIRDGKAPLTPEQLEAVQALKAPMNKPGEDDQGQPTGKLQKKNSARSAVWPLIGNRAAKASSRY